MTVFQDGIYQKILISELGTIQSEILTPAQNLKAQRFLTVLSRDILSLRCDFMSNVCISVSKNKKGKAESFEITMDDSYPFIYETAFFSFQLKDKISTINEALIAYNLNNNQTEHAFEILLRNDSDDEYADPVLRISDFQEFNRNLAMIDKIFSYDGRLVKFFNKKGFSVAYYTENDSFSMFETHNFCTQYPSILLSSEMVDIRVQTTHIEMSFGHNNLFKISSQHLKEEHIENLKSTVLFHYNLQANENQVDLKDLVTVFEMKAI